MKRIKIALVFGTRPEAIKMAPLAHLLMANPNCFDLRICVTGQHRELLNQAMSIFQMTPDIDLDLMRQGQDLFDVTSSVLLSMRCVYADAMPDVVLVHGDTTTAFASALAAFYSGIPVGHVEAGLRTYDLQAPFPEEFNRQGISRIARWHFSPTELNRKNLLSEGIRNEDIFVTGNTVIDALGWVLKRIERDDRLRAKIVTGLNKVLPFCWRDERFVLVTGHRRENFGDGFDQICLALQHLASHYPDIQFVYPVHLNPNVQNPVRKALGDLGNVHLLAPLEYTQFVYLLKHCYFVLTDSGGVQEEAPSLGKPVLVMREVTERPEALAAGTVQLVGASEERIYNGVRQLLDDEKHFASMARATNPYGDGQACERIVSFLRQQYPPS
jgi:UDP-N-acetylglucosamine 2-epimerase (non-hydrolysing)